MDKQSFLKKLQTEREEWEYVLSFIPDNRMSLSGVSGEMSIKDLIAHVSWYEQEMVGLLSQQALAGSELWELPADERNTVILASNRGRGLNEVRSEAQRVFSDLVGALQAFPVEELSNPALFRNMPDDWVPWMVIAENTFDHYRQHIGDVRDWLSKISGN